MELLYIALAAYSVGIGSILLPKKLELAAHYCATLAAIVGVVFCCSRRWSICCMAA